MKRHREFWDKEYTTAEHLALSAEPSEDLEKFTRWMERSSGRRFLNPTALAVDLGCGNGRNLVYLAREFGMRGSGFDISEVAIKQARSLSAELPIVYEARSIEGDIAIADQSATLVLDMMTSHFLKEREREQLRDEIARILKPGGFLFFKSFLAEDDLNVKRLLRDHPADEPDAYIHPELGVYEHVWTEDSLREFFTSHFEIHKIEKSHRHRDRQGHANKRRTISAYLEKLG